MGWGQRLNVAWARRIANAPQVHRKRTTHGKRIYRKLCCLRTVVLAPTDVMFGVCLLYTATELVYISVVG